MQSKNIYKILCITKVSHIHGLNKILCSTGSVKFLEDPSYNQVKKIIHKFDAIFTNPNKTRVLLDEKLIKLAKKLKVICTASTGTNHIDISFAKKQKIKVISLKEERNIISKISSTAELAFSFTLLSIRNIFQANQSVNRGEWDYSKHIGRQLNSLTIGIIGFGRLGKFYSRYCKAFKCKLLVYDPYKKITQKNVTQVNSIKNLLKKSDVISLHVHLNNNTKNLINKNNLRIMKKNVILINTSRSEIINELDLVKHLKNNKKMQYFTDVLSDEINRKNNLIIKEAKKSVQIFITPHIGGMTKEAQLLAYTHAAKLLKKEIFKP